MFSKLLTATAVALSASTLVAAQTSSSCDPTKTSCRPVDPAFGNTPVTVDFTKGPNDVFEVPSWTTVTYDPALGAVFAVSKDSDAPTINTKKYLFYGKVDVVARASLGVGVVTSVVLQSDDLDEIDWEWLGGDGVEVQTNYFSKGDTTTYDRGGKSPVSNPQAEFHTYTIEWTPAVINWIIDGTVVRTLTYNDAKGGTTFPQTPMQLKLGTWVAGKPGAPQGTVDWAGGYPDYSAAPFYGYYKSVSITDYTGSAGDKIVNAGTYTYADGSGSSGSIQVHLSDGSSSGGSSSSSAPGSTSKPTTTAAPSTSSTPSSSSTLSTSTTAANSTTVAPTQSSSGITAGVITTSSSSSKPTTSSPTTVAPGNAAGKLAIGFGNAAVVGAAMFVGALAL